MCERSGSCPIRWAGPPPYNDAMSKVSTVSTVSTEDPACVAGTQPFGVVAGRAVLEALTHRDFAALAEAVAPDATLTALVPRGPRVWDGTEGVRRAFDGWFADLTDYEIVDATIREVGSRLRLSWRVRVRGERLGDGWYLVEQYLYADPDPSGRLRGLRLLCSGYCPEPTALR
jgi:hypothetical protein